MKKTNTIILLMLLLCVGLVSSHTWNQWIPSPTTGNLNYVFSFPNGNAFAANDLISNCFLFNGDDWSETYCPDDTLNSSGLSGYPFMKSGAVSRLDDKLLFVYRNNISNDSQLVVYYSSNNSYSIVRNIPFDIAQTGIAPALMSGNMQIVCIEDEDICISQARINRSVYEVYPDLSFIAAGVGTNYRDRIIYSNNEIMMTEYSNDFLYEWNGFSWIARSSAATTSTIFQHVYLNAIRRYVFGQNNFYNSIFNVSTGLFVDNMNLSLNVGDSQGIFVYGDKIIFVDASSFYEYDINNNYASITTNASNTLYSLSYDDNTGYAWAVGAGGIIYYLSTGLSGSSLERGIIDNPSTLGQDTVFWVKPTVANEPAIISVDIYNSTEDLIYSFSFSGVNSGVNTSNTIDSIAWSNFEIGDYSVVYTLTDAFDRSVSYTDDWSVTSGSFNITPITISTQNGCINRTIRFNINTEKSSGVYLNYDYSCDGAKSPLTNNYRVNEFFCAYTTEGNRTIYGYVWDEENPDYVLYDSIEVNITSCDGNYSVMGTVYDYDTALPISGVNVTLSDGQSALSDLNGNVYFLVASSSIYTVYLTKDDYFSESFTATTSGLNGWYIKSLSGSEGGLRTTLKVRTVNSGGTIINSSLVSVLDPISGQSSFGITNAVGEYVFVDIFVGNRILVSASNEPKNYLTSQEYIEILFGNNYELTLTLLNKTVVGVYYGNSRMCVDALKGVLLCGNLTVGGVGSNCSVDADCISDRCMPNKMCSNFNWTVCDSHGLTRGQYCFVRATAEGGLSGLTNIIFSFFIFVCVILFVIGIFILLRKRNS